MADTDNKKRTIVEEGTRLTGVLTSSCPVQVNGTIDGEFTAPELTITSSGVVMGNIKANKLTSEGRLAGTIEADDIRLAGTVEAGAVIKAQTLDVRLSSENGKKLQLTFSECTLDIGEDPHDAEDIPIN